MSVWVNGGLRAEQAATVSVFDHGLTVGDGVFETIKVVDGVPFALRRHLHRLGDSARGLGLPEPDLEEVRRGVRSVIGAVAQSGVHRLRITYTAGPAPLGSERADVPPTVVVAAAAAGPWPSSEQVAVVPWPRNERGALSGLKTTSYGENVVALAHARDNGAGEALFLNTVGELCEGTGSNVFVVIDGALCTPRLESGCLAGITRALVVEWSGAEERALSGAVLADAEEVFLTSTTRDVQPVSSMSGLGEISGVAHGAARRALPTPGPVTAQVMATFASMAAQDVDP